MPISEIILSTATATRMADRLMHLPGNMTFQDFEIGRQANTKQPVRIKDPIMMNPATAYKT
jgi:hypothetical protein